MSSSKENFKGIILSPDTSASRFTDLAANVEKTITFSVQEFEAFSIADDESTDVSGTAQRACHTSFVTILTSQSYSLFSVFQ